MLDPVAPSAVLDWAAAHDLDDLLRTHLDGEGIALVTVCRRGDGRAWPHASRGFFPFRERVPGLVHQR